MVNYYSILGIPENASEEVIRKAYRRMAKLYHPDVSTSKDAQTIFILLNKAYEVLIDRQQRIAYDHKLNAGRDPFHTYTRWAQEQKNRQETEAKRKYNEFIYRKEKIKQSKMYYPYMILLYLCTLFIIGMSLLVLMYCAYAVLFKSVFMFFFLLPFICLAAFVLKITLDEYKKYKQLFS